ncbi:MAG TPA: hypothetical protein VF909_12335 [Roseiflexaceae bacterium]
MSDPDIVAWVDAAGTAHSPLNMPALDASQRTIVLQIRDYFDMDAHFWQQRPLVGDDLDAVDLLLRVILPTAPQTEIVQRDALEKVRFLIRWFALQTAAD